jgi:hypothetical protein
VKVAFATSSPRVKVAFATSILFAALAAAAVLGACANNVGDEECTPDTNPDDRSDGCPYGEPGGPKVTESQCNTPQKDPKSAACKQALAWPNLYKKLVAEQSTGGGGCADAGCHGAGAGGITLTKKDAVGALNTLQTYVGAELTPYIDTQHPQFSWIACNAFSKEGGGVPMPPPSGLQKPLADEVELWVACGAPH